MASSIVSLHLLAQEDQNEMQHNFFFSYVTLLALNGIVNSTTAFIRSR